MISVYIRTYIHKYVKMEATQYIVQIFLYYFIPFYVQVTPGFPHISITKSVQIHYFETFIVGGRFVQVYCIFRYTRLWCPQYIYNIKSFLREIHETERQEQGCDVIRMFCTIIINPNNITIFYVKVKTRKLYVHIIIHSEKRENREINE